jgi:hypothetical protein
MVRYRRAGEQLYQVQCGRADGDAGQEVAQDGAEPVRQVSGTAMAVAAISATRVKSIGSIRPARHLYARYQLVS